jgi:TPR repeat protein
MYIIGRGVLQDYREAVKWLSKAAEQGEASAQGILGVMYAKGQGVPQDVKKAFNWYIRAAEQGFAIAQNNLGMMYAKGQGVPKDDTIATSGGNLAASAGN